MADTFITGYDFNTATGLKTGANLEDMVTQALFAPASPALDQVTLDDDGAGVARIKDGGVDTAQIATGALSADATGRAKMADDFFDGQDGLDKFADNFWSADAAGRLPFADGVISTDQLADDAVTDDKILDGTISYDKLEARAGVPTAEQNFPFHAYLSADQTITKNTWTKIQFDQTLINGGSKWFGAAGTPAYSYEPGVTGTYFFTGRVALDDSLGIGNVLKARIYKNGVAIHESTFQKAAIADEPCVMVSGLINLNVVTDYIQLFVYHDASVSKDINGVSFLYTAFQGYMVSEYRP